jgi:hypothetical protein
MLRPVKVGGNEGKRPKSIALPLPGLSVVKLKNVQPVAGAKNGCETQYMTKALAVLLIIAMGVQIVKPLGWPGFRRRMDFWKLALFAFVIWAVALTVREIF